MAKKKGVERPDWLDKVKIKLRPGEEKPLGTGTLTNPAQTLEGRRKNGKGKA